MTTGDYNLLLEDDRASFDRKYAKGSCPPPGKSRKWNYLPISRTSQIHNTILLICWIPLAILLFCVALPINIVIWAVAFLFQGGTVGKARSLTQPRSNILIRTLLSLIDVINCVEIPKKWDKTKAASCFEAFRLRNKFSDKEVKFEMLDIDESVTKAEVFHKWHQGDRHPAKLHRVIVLFGPAKTFIVTLTDFAEYDGTSCFNLVKGFVQTYYDGADKAPLVRVMENNPELDLQLTDDLKDKLTAGLAFKCCFIQAFNYALMYGRWLLSREIFDLLGCASPTVVAAIETLDLEVNAEVAAAVKKKGMKMFPHIMSTSSKTLSQLKTKIDKPILLTQVSTQARYYKPKVERNVCGNWLVGLGCKASLDTELSDPSWCAKYYSNLINHIESFSGEVAKSFTSQALFGFMGTAFWANPRIIYWFNNYGIRDMHKDAGGVTYHWGPNYTVATYCLINVVSCDGRTCITLLSSVIPQGELVEAAKMMKRLMIEEVGIDSKNRV